MWHLRWPLGGVHVAHIGSHRLRLEARGLGVEPPKVIGGGVVAGREGLQVGLLSLREDVRVGIVQGVHLLLWEQALAGAHALLGAPPLQRYLAVGVLGPGRQPEARRLASYRPPKLGPQSSPERPSQRPPQRALHEHVRQLRLLEERRPVARRLLRSKPESLVFDLGADPNDVSLPQLENISKMTNSPPPPQRRVNSLWLQPLCLP